ncbi:MAG: hypothetical protein KatS3mg110_3251 [Pirellulaceae bacterium]|nr:MAG: hypothetical protein KatS3mg110_3251 [Pirellulaceae bacterium]
MAEIGRWQWRAGPAMVWLGVLLVVACVGCATTRMTDTPRSAVEQLLVSQAVDLALARVDFAPLAGRKVFVQEKYLDGIDKNYVAASVRHRVLSSGAHLVDKEADADVVVEIRSGGLGTDRTESFIGSPQLAVPGPMPIQIPEVQVVTNKRQTATAKIGIVAYDARTRQALGAGGVSIARSDDNNWFVLGMGPFQSGSVREEMQQAAIENVLPLELARIIPFRPFHDESDESQAAPVTFEPSASESGPFLQGPAVGQPGWPGFQPATGSGRAAER